MKHSIYHIKNESLAGLHLAVISDLHGCDPSEAIEILKASKPDHILAPGDIFELLDGSRDDANENGFLLLSEAAKIAPTIYSLGNHEIGGTRSWTLKWRFKNSTPIPCSKKNAERLGSLGIHILDNGYEKLGGIAFGGLGSGLVYEGRAPRTEWLSDFYAEDCPKILLCHHPEYYKKYVDADRLDLIVSGHAHGGQWRFFGRGIFAPGQGIFPKYTSGIYDGKLAVSRGMKKSGLIPRIFNSTEVLSVVFD